MRKYKLKIAIITTTWLFASSVSAATIALAQTQLPTTVLSGETLLPIGVVIAAIGFAVRVTWSVGKDRGKLEERICQIERNMKKMMRHFKIEYEDE